MQRFNSPGVMLVSLTLFSMLVWWSQRDLEHGYTQHEVREMESLIAANTYPQTNAEKIVYLFGENEQ